MAKWNYRAVRHHRIGKILYQVNIPINENIPEFEVVAFENGRIVDRGIGWDSQDSHMDYIKKMSDYLNEEF